MITLVFDPYCLKKEYTKPSYTYLHVEDYVKLRLIIRELIHQRKDSCILIRDKILCTWLSDFEYYPENIIQIEDLTEPKERLRDLLRTKFIPDKLTDELVISLDLLIKAKTVKFEENDVEDWILKTCVHECWGLALPDWQHLGSLIEFFLHSKDKEFIPFLDDLMKKKFQVWLNSALDEVKKAYEWLCNSPMRNASLITYMQVLAPYPEGFKKEFLKVRYKIASSIKEADVETLLLNLKEIRVNKELLESMNDSTHIYWNGIFKNVSPTLELIDKMSGKLKGELQSIRDYLITHKEIITPLLLDKMQAKFNQLPEAESIIVELRSLSRPDFPSEPSSSWNWDDWSRWAVDEYLIYRFWVEKNNKPRQELDQYSVLYQDWLFKHYPSLKNQLAPLVYGTFSRVKQLIEQGNRVIWIIVDNLSWESYPIIRDEFEKEKLQLCQTIPLISMLPSETSTSKFSILGGKLPAQLQEQQPEKMLISCWQALGITVKLIRLKYLRNEVSTNKERLFVVLYNELDEIAHRPTGKIEDRERKIRDGFKYIAEQVGGAIKYQEDFIRIKLVLSSDHGSCRLLKNAKKISIPRHILRDKIYQKHRRLAKFKDEKDIDSHDTYILSKNAFGLTEKYIIPKGYGYFERKPFGYTHGGLSPEETIVPYMEFGFSVTASIKDLEVVYREHALRKGHQENLEFVVRNPNNIKVQNILLQLPKYEVKTNIAYIEGKHESETENIQIVIDPKERVHKGEINIDALVAFLIFGKRVVKEIKIAIPIRELAIIEKFDEMFPET